MRRGAAGVERERRGWGEGGVDLPRELAVAEESRRSASGRGVGAATEASGEGEGAVAVGSRRGEGIGEPGGGRGGYCKNGLRGDFHKNDKILEFLLLRVEINFSLRAYSKNM